MDASGHTRQTILRGNASLATVTTDLLALSRADWQRCWEGATVINGAPAPTTGDYQTADDYAVLVYADGSGNQVYITLPAPNSSIFLADQETVDSVAIATLTANVTGTILTGAGLAVTTYIGGFRRKKLKEYQ